MRAVRIVEYGSLSLLSVRDLPNLVPGPDDVLVRVAAAGVNPSDVKNARGLMPHTTLPRTPGRDFAGTVVAGHSALVGADVWGSGGELGFAQDGTHAEFVRVARDAVCPKPTHLSMEAAACVGVPFVTAWAMLMEAAQMTAHDTVLVVGASGAVGSAAVQIASWKGARVIGTVRRESQVENVRARGAEAVLVTAGDDLPVQIKEVTKGRGASVVLDTVGGPLVPLCLAALAPQGRLAEIAAAERYAQIDLLDFYRRELGMAGVNTLTRGGGACARILQALAAGFETGALQPPSVAARFGLEQVTEAYEASGKVVLVP